MSHKSKIDLDNSEMKIRFLVMDDELQARQSICRQIEKNCPNFEVIRTASSAAEACQVIKECAPFMS